MPPVNLAQYRPQYMPKDSQAHQLSFSLALQKATLAAQGGKVPSSHPSILNRVFDIVSRPSYAVAGAYNEVVNKINQNKAAHKGGNIMELPGLLAKGVVGGLEGKKKANFGEVLGNMGVKNPIVKGVAGFAAGAALDPLNFVTPGIEMAASPFEGAAAAGPAIRGAQLAGGQASNLSTIGSAASTAAKASRPGSLSVNLLGRPVLKSEAAYRGATAALRPVANTGLARWANTSFRTASNLPGQLKDYYRVNKIAGAAGYNDAESEIMSRIGHLTRDEGNLVSNSLEHGIDLTGQVSKDVSKAQGLGNDLGAVQKYWLDTKNAWDKNEQDLGIFRPGQGLDTYVPHKFPSKAEFDLYKEKGYASQMWKATEGSVGGTPVAQPTLNDLKTAGLHPHENIVDLMRLRAADHYRDVSKAAFHKNAIEQFGTTFAGPGKKAAEAAAETSNWVKLSKKVSPYVGNPNVMGGAKDVWVPKQVEHAMKTLNNLYTSDEATTKFLETFDNIQRLWKTGVTTVNPSHHIRNMIGDSFLNYEAGVTNPADYTRAMKVLRGTGSVKVGNMMVDAADLKNLYRLHGGAAGFFNTDLVGGGQAVGTILENPASKLNQGIEALRHVTAQREDFMRLANFTHAMKQFGEEQGAHTWNDLEELAKQATARVRKFNFDYGDLTQFESKVRRFVPFYTFMRKNMPLQLEMLALHPNKISRVPQGFAAVSQLLGTDPQHLPISEVVPQYIKDLAGVRLRGEGQNQNALYSTLNLPVSDISQLFSGSTSEVLRKAAGQLTPALRMPIEMGTKQSLQSGAPIYGGEGGYLMNQFGISRNIRDTIAGPGQPHSIVRPGQQQGSNSGMNWINWLSGAGLKEITPQVEKSELKRQQAPITARLKQLRIQRVNRALGTGR